MMLIVVFIATLRTRLSIFWCLPLLATALCLGGCRSVSASDYLQEGQKCLAAMSEVEAGMQAGQEHVKIAPRLVTAKISIDDFLKKYKRPPLPDFNNQLQAVLEAYLDSFIINDLIIQNRPVRRGSVIEQQVTSRYPELIAKLGPINEELDKSGAEPILRRIAQDRLERARSTLDHLARRHGVDANSTSARAASK